MATTDMRDTITATPTKVAMPTPTITVTMKRKKMVTPTDNHTDTVIKTLMYRPPYCMSLEIF